MNDNKVIKSRIIKSSERPPLGDELPGYKPSIEAPVIKSSVYDANSEARRIVDRAREQAEQLLADAESELEAQRAELYAQQQFIEQQRTNLLQERELALAAAQEQGYKDGFAAVNELLIELVEKKHSVLAQAETDIIRLSIRVAARILGRELRQHPDTIADIVTQAIQAVRSQTKITVRINPDDLVHLTQNRDQLLNRVGQSKIIDFQSDSKVQPGGCIIESEAGTVNAQLKTQLAVMERMLLKRSQTP
jgi:type III secretion protein L